MTEYSDDVAAICAEIEQVGDGPAPELAALPPDTKTTCLQYLNILSNVPSYRLGIAVAELIDIAYEYSVLSEMVELFRLRDDPVGALAGPAMAELVDICAAEGIRRGVIFATGDDVMNRNYALDLVDEMVAAFTPDWAMLVGHRG